jgi:hypothetical protein
LRVLHPTRNIDAHSLLAVHRLFQEVVMPRGDKSKYSSKQKRQAEHIEEGYEKRGVGEGEAERRAWATVNKMTGGGKRGGSGRGKKTNKEPARKGGRKGGKAAAKRSAAAKSASGRKAAATRKRRAKSGSRTRKKSR